MKTKAIVASMVMLCCLSTAVLLATATETHEGVAAEAIRRGDTPKLIKVLISGMKERMEVDEDDFPELIGEVERYAGECGDTASAAVLHSMTAEMYHHYYTANRRKIDRRSDIEGYTPEDIREWTTGIFTRKIREELEASLRPDRLLKDTPADKFRVIMETGDDSPTLRPTLYEFLAFRALDIAPSAELYSQIVAYLNTREDKKAAVLATLDYLRFLHTPSRTTKAKKAYAASLDSLLSVYADKDYSVEIIEAKMEAGLCGLSADADSVRAAEYEICRETVARFPRYGRIGLIKNRLAEMQNPTLQVSAPRTVYPEEMLCLKLSYRNIPRVVVRTYHSMKTPAETLSYNEGNTSGTRETLVREVECRLNVPNSYTTVDTTLLIPTDNMGLYEYTVSSPLGDVSVNGMFQVSRLAAISRTVSDGGTEVLVADYLSGKPATDATVTYYSGTRDKMQLAGTAGTDKYGIAAFLHEENRIAYLVGRSGDEQIMLTQVYSGGRRVAEPKERPQVALFTDRGLYRPGQTVSFKGIVYERKADLSCALEGETFRVTLRDAAGKEVSSQSLRTNRFGSFGGEFALPQTTLGGVFTLSTETASIYFRVEEYKRPTFRVDLLPIEGEVSFGDTATIRGKAETFSGIPLQGGEVTYRIIRQPLPLRGYRLGGNVYEEVAEGKTVVGSDGAFAFSFTPEKQECDGDAYGSYRISATLTNQGGETQEANSVVTLGECSIVLTTDIPERMERDSACAIVTVRTLNDEQLSTIGSYTIHRLKDKETLSDDEADNETHEVDKQMASGSFTSGKEIDRSVLRKLPSGRYRITLKASDLKGRPASTERDFIIYSLHDSKPPIKTHIWLPSEEMECLVGEEAKVLFGTSDKGAHVLYELFMDGECISRQSVVMSDENRFFNIPFKENYGDGVVAMFTFIKKGKLHKAQVEIKRRQPDRKLTVCPTTFRDHLLPGSLETWTFRVHDADSMAVAAEVLASMYDASLDRILPDGAHEWRFNPQRLIYLNAPSFAVGAGMGNRSSIDYLEPRLSVVSEYRYNRLDWQGVLGGGGLNYGRGIMLKSSASPMMMASMTEAGSNDDAGLPPEDTLRENFSETAFFYPSLLTDGKGDVVVRFTLPESNTTWKFRAFAHTVDMKWGSLTEEIISNKPLMVTPHLPRFMREGDEVSVSTDVTNSSGSFVSGEVRLELFDVATGQTLADIPAKTFSLDVDSLATVTWTLRTPDVTGVIGCRIVADAGSASDGEQHLIPVLSNRILITESTPLYLADTMQQHIRLSGFSSAGSRQPYQTMLELTANPVWYAVQALPALTQPTSGDVVSWFASYYGNVLARHIVTSNPRIQQVIRRWETEGGTVSSLYSNLEKNRELKNVILEETPWVLSAESETEQKRRLSLLLDANRAENRRATALQQLAELQTEEGGWSWFKGFPASRQLTLFVLKGMSELSDMNAVEYGEEEKEMQAKAWSYLDKLIQTDYEHLQKTDKAWRNAVPNATQTEYLFVRSSYRDIPETNEARDAIRFYTSRAEKTWREQSLRGKGETALLMQRSGKKDVARSILSWLRKRATVTTEQGMYWANNRRTEGDYLSSPIETHCLLMNVFDALSPDTGETDRMKQWLLSQKRTQHWESAPATLNAIRALTLSGSDWIGEDNRCTASWGSNTYSTTEGDAATGYLKVTIDKKELSHVSDVITVRKEGNAPAWGAVYEQYFENISEVQKQKGVLSVEKKLFVENGQVITPVDGGRLRVGDKVIVRLTVRTDREMDYVCLKDLRAGCFEPAEQISGAKWHDGVVYYQSPTDVSENFFFNRLPKGTFVIEYPVYVSRSGSFAGGISTIQCQYAPEFVSHTEGTQVYVGD